MPEPGDVVTVDFPGATGIKRRPALIVSTAEYHRHRPDVILAVLTSQVAAAAAPTDSPLLDWSSAGLRQPTAFRAYLATVPAGSLRVVGKLTPRDWQAVQERLILSLAVLGTTR